MTFQQATNARIIEVYNKLFNKNYTFQEFVQRVQRDHNVNNVRSLLIRIIQETARTLGYKGPIDNIENIYWFADGRSSRSQPQQINGDNFLNNIRNNINNQRRTRDDSDLPKPTSYKQLKQNADDERQDEIVDNIMQTLRDNPTNWYINFDILTNYGKEKICDDLKNFLNEHISNLARTNQYKLSFSVNGEWHSLPLNEENFNKLYNSLTKKSLIFDEEQMPAEWSYEFMKNDLLEWSLFSGLKLSILKHPRTNNEAGAHFFSYLVKPECPQKVKEYLKRLQIFESLVDENGKQRKELNDCCFIYSLEQTGNYSKQELNQIRLRIQNRYLHQTAINHLCEEFKIRIKLTYINEELQGKNKKQTVRSTKDSVKKNYMGVSDPATNRVHHFNIFEKHYFIEEVTPFSCYYIKHLNECDDDKSDKQKKGDRWRKAEHFISSSNLVRELFKQNYFVPITFGQSLILKTVYYNEIDCNLQNVDLHYNPEFCLKLIKPKKVKEAPEKVENTYWFADFETDISGDIHKPFMCCLQNEQGTIKKCFKGEKCNIELLEFLPDNSIIYFHNLGYDIRMLASFGIKKSIIKGTKTMMSEIKYNGKTLHFKDSLPVLFCKLSQLPKMFNIPDVQKELFPYKYYTLERIINGKGVINEAGKNEDKPWKEDDYILFYSIIILTKLKDAVLIMTTLTCGNTVSFIANKM